MADWLIISTLILIGIALLVTEIIIIPGTTVFGLLGLVLMVLGIYFSYDLYGQSIGSYILFGSVLVIGGALVYGLKSKTWKKLALNSQIKSKVREEYASSLRIGQEGSSVSDLKPIGNAEFNNSFYEVTTRGGLIESKKQIRIVKILGNKIVVELINK